MTMMALRVALLLFLVGVKAFISSLKPQRRSTGLNDITEWRDLVFDFPGTGDDRRLGVEQGAPPKEICLLPFPFSEVLLQGETKQLRLYEERFMDLFEDCMANHCGVVGMGLLAKSGIIQTIPLCEIEAYNRMGEGFGIFVTIRVVSRAKLVDLTQQEPYIKAVCTECVDEIPPNLDVPNLVASQIENFMLLLSSMEFQLAKATEKSGNDDEEDEEMQRRINVANLDDRFFNDDEDEEDENERELDRRGRFNRAYQIALATDTNGYFLPKQDTVERTPKELTAISWASFCTEILEEEDATFRIQALDCESLLDRLKLASHMLQGKKAALQKRMEKAGLKSDEDNL
jgi:Lon protease-like protein